MDKYIYVAWPDSQDFMEHPRYKECFMAIPVGEDVDNVSGGSILVPEDLYNEVTIMH